MTQLAKKKNANFDKGDSKKEEEIFSFFLLLREKSEKVIFPFLFVCEQKMEKSFFKK